MIELNKIFTLFLSTYLIFLQVSVSLAESDGRIVGGVSTTIDQAPFLVQIKNNGILICSGTLITSRHVVTAAHCFKYNPQDLLVVGGATRITDKGTASSRVSRYILHKNFTVDTYDMDVAVIRLKTPLKGRNIKPISFKCDEGWKVDQTVKLFGWGTIDFVTQSVPIDLQTVDVQVVDKKICAGILRFHRTVTNSMACAAGVNKDACGGDSGGPALINNQFCGIVSWGLECAQEDTPSVYTNINMVKKFISRAIWKLNKTNR